jgi:hypothetical protein
MRVVVEQPKGGVTLVDADAQHASPEDVTALRVRIATSLPGARVVKLGDVARVEIPGERLDPSSVDEAIDALGEACAMPERGPFR